MDILNKLTRDSVNAKAELERCSSLESSLRTSALDLSGICFNLQQTCGNVDQFDNYTFGEVNFKVQF